MKNSFNIEVSFSKVPLQSFEWENTSFISGIKVIRVTSKCLEDLMTYEGIIESKSKILLLSDTKSSQVFKLSDDGLIVARSFLTFNRDLDIMEMACNLKVTNIKYTLLNKKVPYSLTLKEEEKIKDYLITSLNKMKDEDKSKYLYYLYFDNLNDYSKEKLISSIKEDALGRYQELYDFLIKN